MLFVSQQKIVQHSPSVNYFIFPLYCTGRKKSAYREKRNSMKVDEMTEGGLKLARDKNV